MSADEDKIEADRDRLAAEVKRLSQSRRPFSDAFAERVIDGQVKQIDELTARLIAMRNDRDRLAEIAPTPVGTITAEGVLWHKSALNEWPALVGKELYVREPL